MNESLALFKKRIVSQCQQRIYQRFPEFTPVLFFMSTYEANPHTYTVVTVKGYNFFPNNTQILFGTKIVPVSFYGSTQITFVVPMDLPFGQYEVKAVNVTNFSPLYPVTQKISNSFLFDLVLLS